MMKKTALILVLVTIFSLNAKAQNDGLTYKFGLFAGANFANMKLDERFISNNMGDSIRDGKQQPRVCFRIGGLFELNFNKYTAFQTELLYSQTGFKYKGTYIDDVTSLFDYKEWDCKSKTSIHSLSIAVLIKIRPVKFMTIDLGVQPNINVSVTKNDEIKYGQIVNKSINSYKKDGYNTFSADAVFGLTFNPTENFFITARYNLGLTNVLKLDTPYYDLNEYGYEVIKHYYTGAESKNRTAQLSIGFIF